jgi:hypothetical protein
VNVDEDVVAGARGVVWHTFVMEEETGHRKMHIIPKKVRLHGVSGIILGRKDTTER